MWTTEHANRCLAPDAWMKMRNYNPWRCLWGRALTLHQATIATGYARMPIRMASVTWMKFLDAPTSWRAITTPLPLKTMDRVSGDACGVCGGNGTSCAGCTSEEARNYDPSATMDSGDCEFAPQYFDRDGNFMLSNVRGPGPLHTTLDLVSLKWLEFVRLIPTTTGRRTNDLMDLFVRHPSMRQQQQKAPTTRSGLFYGIKVVRISDVMWLAFVATDGAAHQVFAFHAVKGSFSFFLVGHFNKPKTTRPSSFTIVDDPCTVHRSIGLRLHARRRHNAPSKVSNKNVHINKLEDSAAKVGDLFRSSAMHKRRPLRPSSFGCSRRQ